MKYFVVVLSIILLLPSGCAKRQGVSQEPAWEDEILFEEITEDTTEISDITFTEEPEKDISIFEEEKVEVITTEPTTRLGFRIQIGAYNNKALAQKEAEKARMILNKKVYVDYIMPYNKLRVGNFLTRSDAVSYRVQVLNKGYKGAFIVETTIIVE